MVFGQHSGFEYHDCLSILVAKVTPVCNNFVVLFEAKYLFHHKIVEIR